MIFSVVDGMLHYCVLVNIGGESHGLMNRRKNSLPTERRGEISE